MRSYVVKRLLHFRHSRRRRMDSASLLSRESTTLSFAKPQKGHFMALLSFQPNSKPYDSNAQAKQLQPRSFHCPNETTYPLSFRRLTLSVAKWKKEESAVIFVAMENCNRGVAP